MNICRMVFPLVLSLSLSLCTPATYAKGALKGPYRIGSESLGYDLQYWVYLPENARKPIPELYVTDGNAYLAAGDLVDVLDSEIETGRIEPFGVIFVDSRDPDYPEASRRNREFMCNVDYAKFYVGELMPEVSRLWTGADPSTVRGMMGVSFGGINSACFGMMLPGVFQLLIMHSPASDAHLDVIDKLYRERPPNPSAFFVSHGGPGDNGEAAEHFVRTLESRGYPVQHVTTDGGHDWDQWRPLLDDSLQAFSAVLEERRTAADDAPPENAPGNGR